MVIGTYISIVTLKLKGLNAPTKRHRLAEWIRKINIVKMHHQTSYTRNVKGTSLGKKEKVTTRNMKIWMEKAHQ